jgi:hypothetical protein
LVFGRKLAVKVFEPGDGDDAGRVVLKTIRTKRNAAWNFVVEPTGDVVAIQALTFDAGLRDLPPEKFLILSWMPRDGDPRGRSILRAAYNGWNLKLNTFPKYFKYLDKFGSPILVGSPAPDAPEEPEFDERGLPTGRFVTASEAMGNAFHRLENGSYIITPPGSTVTPIHPAGEGQAFLQAFTLFKTEILEAILISARSIMPARHSSKADSETSQDTVGQLLLYGRELLEDGWREQVFKQLIALNYGDEFANLYTPHVSLGSVEHQDIAAVAMAYAQLGYTFDPMQFPAIDAKLSLPVRSPTVENVAEVDGNPVNFAEREDADDPFSRARPRMRRPARS